jgi:sugar/nucleoside kinase (ribokinase family)
MADKKYDVVGIGHAIVDILAYSKKQDVDENGLKHGAMELVDEERSEKIYQNMGSATECSGGSAGNTIAGIAMLGGKAAFIGKVKDDTFGKIYKSDMKRSGVEFFGKPTERGAGTGKCLIMVTEDKDSLGNVKYERSMATYLGVSSQIEEDDVDENLIASSKVVFFEGYLWDSPKAKQSIKKAIRIAQSYGVKVAFSLSDPFCVDRYKSEFKELLRDVDILFANEHEAESLFNAGDIRNTLAGVNGLCETVCVTRSEKGSYVISGGEVHSIDAVSVPKIFDVTGAGDLYATGVLYGLTNNLGLERSGKLGSLCASQVIQYIGARPMMDMKSLLKLI